jgi:hypothetical protein
MKLIHATCVCIFDLGVLLRGPSGCGKSDLALRLIMKGARLVADDYVYVSAEKGALYAAAPEEIYGKLEVRGVGIVSLPFTRVSRVAAIADLAGEGIERLPPPLEEVIEGVALPCFRLNPFESASVEKLLMLLRGGLER